MHVKRSCGVQSTNPAAFTIAPPAPPPPRLKAHKHAPVEAPSVGDGVITPPEDLRQLRQTRCSTQSSSSSQRRNGIDLPDVTISSCKRSAVGREKSSQPGKKRRFADVSISRKRSAVGQKKSSQPEKERRFATCSAASQPSGSRWHQLPCIDWATPMVQALQAELRDALEPGPLLRRGTRIGTDCSGAEAPIWALRELIRALKCVGLPLQMDHRFSCDVAHEARTFIRNNCQPKHFFANLNCRSRLSHCIENDELVMVPSDLDIYIAGFPCKDFSLLNPKRSCLEGPNASILAGVVRYIREHQPAVFILENVAGLTYAHGNREKPIAQVMEELRSIPGYEARGWRVNSSDFYLPQRRERVYIVGVNTRKASLRKPLTEWQPFLKLVAKETEFTAHDFMIPNDAPEVCEAFDWLRHRRDNPKVKRTKPQIYKWFNKNALFRKKHRLADVQTVKDDEGWCELLGGRMREVLELRYQFLQKQTGVDPDQTNFIGDISQNLDHCTLSRQLAPCVTPTGRFWVFSRHRWILPEEKLALQGFPVSDLNLRGINPIKIDALAGNSMSVPVIGAFLLLALGLVQFNDDDAEATVNDDDAEAKDMVSPLLDPTKG